MTTMIFESGYAPRRTAARRGQRSVPRVGAVEGQSVTIAVGATATATALRIARGVHRSRNRAGLIALIVMMAALHAAILVAANRHESIQHVSVPKTPPLAIDIAPPKQEPPPPVFKPKPLPQAMKPIAKPVNRPRPVSPPAPSEPVVRDDTPVDHAPAPDAVRVAPAAVAPEPAPAPAERVTEPRGYAGYLSNPAPVYPSAAQKRGLEGRVVLKVHVLANGRPDNIAVAKSSGHEILDAAAVTAVTSWVFEPAKRGQTPIDGWVNVPLNFKLS
jgi:periplasmic protein TonB